MANNITQMGWPYQLLPTGRFSIEGNKQYDKYSSALEYAKNDPTSYVGNILYIINDETVGTGVDAITYPAGVYAVTGIGADGAITQVGKDTDLSNYYTKEEVDEKITGIYRFQGSCKSEDLSNKETSATAGDVWNLTTPYTSDGITYPIGTNVAWVGAKTENGETIPAHWDVLGGWETAADELKKLNGSGTGDVIADGDILTATVDANGTSFSWKQAPVSTSVNVDDTVVNSVGGVTIALATGENTVRTITQDDKTVNVYSKDIIDAVIAAIKTETSDLYWQPIKPIQVEPEPAE